MSAPKSVSEKLQVTVTTYRVGFAIAGVIGIVLGILVLAWPYEVIKIAAFLVGLYALLMGLFQVYMAFKGKKANPYARVGRVVTAVAFLTAGIVMLSFLSASAAVLTNVLGIVLGAMWLAEGLSAIIMLKVRVEQNAWATGYAVIAIILGAVLLLTPVWGPGTLRWIGGIALLLLGAAQVYRASQARAEVKVDVAVDES